MTSELFENKFATTVIPGHTSFQIHYCPANFSSSISFVCRALRAKRFIKYHRHTAVTRKKKNSPAIEWWQQSVWWGESQFEMFEKALPIASKRFPSASSVGRTKKHHHRHRLRRVLDSTEKSTSGKQQSKDVLPADFRSRSVVHSSANIVYTNINKMMKNYIEINKPERIRFSPWREGWHTFQVA